MSIDRVEIALDDLEKNGVKPEYIKLAGPTGLHYSSLKNDYIAIWHRNPPYNE